MRKNASRIYTLKNFTKGSESDFLTKEISKYMSSGKIPLLKGICHILDISSGLAVSYATYAMRIEETIKCNLYFDKKNLLIGSYTTEDTEKEVKVGVLEFDLSDSKT